MAIRPRRFTPEANTRRMGQNLRSRTIGGPTSPATPRPPVVLGGGGAGGTTIPWSGQPAQTWGDHVPTGTSPPIFPGTPAPAPSTAGVPLPTLNANQRAMLDERFGGQGGFGPKTGPGEDAIRRLMRQGLAAGLGNGAVNQYMNPAFVRAVNDPYGGGRLLRNLEPSQLRSLSQFARGVTGNATEAQTQFFNRFPGMQEQYSGMANVYGRAPDLTNGASTTPPNAVQGSDGRWHDPTRPLPQGVTILDPSTVQTPAQVEQTNATDQGPQGQPAVAHTPMVAQANGRNPEKHLAYWHSQGWSMNPATGEWTQHGTPQAGPVVNDPNGPQNPRPGPTGGGGGGGGGGGTGSGGGGQGGGSGAGPGALSQLPLDGYYEQQRRMLDDSLQAQLAPLSGAREQLGAYQNLASNRLDTNQDVSHQQLMDNLAARGIYDSGLYGQGLGDISTDYLRQRQDLATSLAGQYGDIASQESGAYLSYDQQLQQALIDLANRMTQDQNAPVARPRRRPRRRGNGGGNG